ncbi:hypothetical protein Y032_0531g3017 [Ancylostoma ceylanicum]|uniref:Uncharacterized protein n=1 Tax=Ancylostoma ceylanicum TaxID=53326 RepID=A0A016WS00_9BILA|nr:hypothetical protein Y032_0531g3017 [Ancylostoma ceylanicum]
MNYLRTRSTISQRSASPPQVQSFRGPMVSNRSIHNHQQSPQSIPTSSSSLQFARKNKIMRGHLHLVDGCLSFSHIAKVSHFGNFC